MYASGQTFAQTGSRCSQIGLIQMSIVVEI